MTNLEKYKKIIIGYVREYGDTPAIMHGFFTRCNNSCEDCDFNITKDDPQLSCLEKFLEWCAAESEE